MVWRWYSKSFRLRPLYIHHRCYHPLHLSILDLQKKSYCSSFDSLVYTMELAKYLMDCSFWLDTLANEYTAYSYGTIFNSTRGKKKCHLFFLYLCISLSFLYFLMYYVRHLLRSIMHRRAIEMHKTSVVAICT